MSWPSNRGAPVRILQVTHSCRRGNVAEFVTCGTVELLKILLAEGHQLITRLKRLGLSPRVCQANNWQSPWPRPASISCPASGPMAARSRAETKTRPRMKGCTSRAGVPMRPLLQRHFLAALIARRVAGNAATVWKRALPSDASFSAIASRSKFSGRLCDEEMGDRLGDLVALVLGFGRQQVGHGRAGWDADGEAMNRRRKSGHHANPHQTVRSNSFEGLEEHPCGRDKRCTAARRATIPRPVARKADVCWKVQGQRAQRSIAKEMPTESASSATRNSVSSRAVPA